MAYVMRRMKLNELNLDVTNSMVIGIIIAKSSPKVFKSRKNSDEARSVWTFTIRDSPNDCINCSVWGVPYFVSSFDKMFHIGDVVNIIGPQIKSRQLDDRNEQYVPQVTSPFQLIVNEKQAEITIHEADDYAEYLPLLHIPTKPAAGYFFLIDVIKNSKNIKEDTVDLLVAIKALFSIRMIKTKLGEEIPLREFTVMDSSILTPLRIILWDPELIKRSTSWQSRETILFIADIKIEWSEFHKAIVGRVTNRTVITEDPYTTEAETLRVYSRHVPLQKTAILNQMSLDIPDPNSIRNVMTVQQVLDRCENGELQFTAMMYVIITQLDLDGVNKLTITKCAKCLSVLKASCCENTECPSSEGKELLETDVAFDIRMTLTDHTGSLTNCRLSGKFAENVLGCNVSDFINMDINTRGQLKWKLLLERCTVRIVVMEGPMVSILMCSVADPNEVVSKLPVY